MEQPKGQKKRFNRASRSDSELTPPPTPPDSPSALCHSNSVEIAKKKKKRKNIATGILNDANLVLH